MPRFAPRCALKVKKIADAGLNTVDRKDFSVYRRHGRRPVRCIFPGQQDCQQVLVEKRGRLPEFSASQSSCSV
jgi:hypothetical protein